MQSKLGLFRVLVRFVRNCLFALHVRLVVVLLSVFMLFLPLLLLRVLRAYQEMKSAPTDSRKTSWQGWKRQVFHTKRTSLKLDTWQKAMACPLRYEHALTIFWLTTRAAEQTARQDLSIRNMIHKP